ncbi:MAG: glycerophosphodiester phosphodiesterase family protein [Chloroflexota bacterium]
MRQAPVIVHHMAALDASPHPPNSLEAIRASLEANAAFIEIDVTALAADDYLLVHDGVLEHETSGVGEVGATLPAETSSLLIKTRDGVVTAYRPPLLSEVVALFGDHPGRMRLQIDYKNVHPMRDDEPLRRFLRLIKPLGEQRVLVSSGADWQLRWMRRNAAWLDLGFDIGFYLDYRPTPVDPRQPPYFLGAYGYHDDHVLAKMALLSPAQYLAERCDMLLHALPDASTWYVDHRLLARALDEDFNMTAWLHERGVKMDAWTMDVGKVPDDAILRLRDAGVDQFTTNTPLALGRLLGV